MALSQAKDTFSTTLLKSLNDEYLFIKSRSFKSESYLFSLTNRFIFVKSSSFELHQTHLLETEFINSGVYLFLPLIAKIGTLVDAASKRVVAGVSNITKAASSNTFIKGSLLVTMFLKLNGYSLKKGLLFNLKIFLYLVSKLLRKFNMFFCKSYNLLSGSEGLSNTCPLKNHLPVA